MNPKKYSKPHLKAASMLKGKYGPVYSDFISSHQHYKQHEELRTNIEINLINSSRDTRHRNPWHKAILKWTSFNSSMITSAEEAVVRA